MSMEALIFIYLNNMRKIHILNEKSKRLRVLAMRSRRKCLFFRRMILMNSTRTVRRTLWTKTTKSKYWEKDVPKMNNDDFKNTFRVDRRTFDFLVSHLNHLERVDTTWRAAIPLRKRVAIALYALGSSAEYRTIASLFGVGRTTVGEIVIEFCEELCNKLQRQYLHMYPPTQEKVEENVRGFERLGFPQCFGAIDGCHIEVNPPKDEATDYYNYKGWYSTVLFACVDYRYRFMYINVGSPGRSNDSTIFQNSQLKVQHEQNPIFERNSKNIQGVDVPVFLIGDSAFRLSRYVMKPFPFSSCHHEKEKKFNFHLSKCRRVVENAFGHLKARFRKLGKGLEVHIDNVSKIIKACCLLHNICNSKNDKINQLWMTEMRSSEKRKQPQLLARSTGDTGEGNIVRNALKEYLCTLAGSLAENGDGPATQGEDGPATQGEEEPAVSGEDSPAIPDEWGPPVFSVSDE